MRVKRYNKFPLLILVFIIVVAGVFCGFKFFLETRSVSRDYGVSYDIDLSEQERQTVESLVDAETKYALPIKIAIKNTAKREDFTIGEMVPVTNWYYFEESITTEEALALANTKKCNQTYCEAILDTTMRLVPVDELNGTERLVAIDDNYYLDNPEKGAIYRVLEFSLDESGVEKVDDKRRAAAELDLAEFKNQLKEKLPALGNKKENILTFAQTGVTALSRAMVSHLNGAAGGNGAYFAENIKDFLSSKDLTHISNEVSFADSCQGGTNTVVLCSDWRMLETIKAIGTDIIELTGNHNNDYAAQANTNTIAKYEELGFKTFGGGKNEESARTPLELNEKNTKITLLGYNQSTTSKQYGGANGSTPGANIYDEAIAKQQITEAKARGDYVIVDIQYYECYSYPDGYTEMPACDYLIANQKAFFRHLVDLGADMVVGTQAHQPQTFELYDGKPIYYGLGNLFFDQTYWPGTTRGYILTHYFLSGKYAQTRISPTVYGATYQTRLMDADSAQAFLSRLIEASPHGE